MVIPCLCLFLFLSCHNKKSPDRMVWGCGGRYRTRTCDLLHVKQMLYQLS